MNSVTAFCETVPARPKRFDSVAFLQRGMTECGCDNRRLANVTYPKYSTCRAGLTRHEVAKSRAEGSKGVLLMRNNLFLGVAAIALVAPMAASAQETTSSIRGTVTSAGTPVVGATVEITNTLAGSRATAITDNSGSFNVNGLRAGGPYTVAVNATGYSATQVTDITTTVAQAFDVPIELNSEAGGGNEIVVTAARLPNARSMRSASSRRRSRRTTSARAISRAARSTSC